MRIRFQADADLNEVIISILPRRAPEIDFQTATTARLEGLGDPGMTKEIPALTTWREV